MYAVVRMLDTTSGAIPVYCENIDKTAPGPIALLIQTAPDPLSYGDIMNQKFTIQLTRPTSQASKSQILAFFVWMSSLGIMQIPR